MNVIVTKDPKGQLFPVFQCDRCNAFIRSIEKAVVVQTGPWEVVVAHEECVDENGLVIYLVEWLSRLASASADDGERDLRPF